MADDEPEIPPIPAKALSDLWRMVGGAYRQFTVDDDGRFRWADTGAMCFPETQNNDTEQDGV